MKYLIAFLLLLFCIETNAQTNWFNTYTDSVALIRDANTIVTQFVSKVKGVDPSFDPQVLVVKNTTPYLIFINDSTVNLPFWMEVSADQKGFFSTVAGGQKEGREVFGLFFNGFYLAHELGHLLALTAHKVYTNAYQKEYDANVIGILYWRAAGKDKQLLTCYQWAKKMLLVLKNPAPGNEDLKTYLTEHYDELVADPYKFGYIQFSQFVEIYENRTLSDFHAFLKTYINK